MRRIRGSDWWIELGLVPLALASVFWALWHSAFLAASGGDYGVGALVLSVFWLLVLFVIDIQRFRHRAAILLAVAPALAVVIAWSAVADTAMAYRGVVEECPVSGSSTYEVHPARGAAYWETKYTLACEQREVEVAFAASAPEATSEEDDYGFGDDFGGGDDYGFDDDFGGGDDFGDDFDSMWDDEPKSIEVEYDPRGLVGPNTDHFVTESDQNPVGLLWFAGVVAAAGIGARLVAARSRAE
ncbi:hypothetical protein [Glycomyces arizonensis]|uniref:hypothetical protein n=1 Tax=Glycomyces arizonensis TaxID=256035 RepID=UPI0003F85172|nr:hypothetical protein [Glycomyces arizonensis]